MEELVASTHAAIFYAEQRNAASCAYNVPNVLEVGGALDTAAAVEACAALARTTPALRLRMGVSGRTGDVVHWFSTEGPEVRCLELTADGGDVHEVLDRAYRRPFETDGGPLARFLVVRAAPDRTFIAVFTHHLICDGVSHVLLPRRLARCLAGHAVEQPESTYQALVRAVRSAEAEARARDRDYWAARLRRVSPSAAERTPASAPVTGTVPCGNHRLRGLGGSLPRLHRIAGRTGSRLFHVLAGAVHRTLALRGAAPAAVCATTSVRPPGGRYDGVQGCFINQVPLVARDPAASLEELVGAEAAGWSADLRRRNYPFMDMARQARAGGGAAPARLDRVMVSYRRAPTSMSWREGGLRLRTDVFHQYAQAKTELSLRFFHHGDELDCNVECSGELSGPPGARLALDLRTTLENG